MCESCAVAPPYRTTTHPSLQRAVTDVVLMTRRGKADGEDDSEAGRPATSIFNSGPLHPTVTHHDGIEQGARNA